jgi:hypothetical protein
MKKKEKKLTLHRETLHPLTSLEQEKLQAVLGGVVSDVLDDFELYLREPRSRPAGSPLHRDQSPTHEALRSGVRCWGPGLCGYLRSRH